MEKIGRYQIMKELGRGAMGVVYAASDPNIGRTVAIKTIRVSDFDGTPKRQELRDRLQREAQAAGILSHPAIVTIHDVGEEGDSAYIVMEFIDGKTMEDILSSGVPQPSDTLMQVLRQSAEALDYAHGKGIIHRDMKPSNIIMCSDGRVKIADFGIARIASSTSLTQTGFVLGTPDYMSPEQAQAHPVDGKADQFSLAVIACRMLTGKLPFSGPTLTAVLTKILWEEPQYLSENLSPEVQRVLRKALAKDPNQRYGTCIEFVEDLQNAYCASRQGAINLEAVGPDVQPGQPENLTPAIRESRAVLGSATSGSRQIRQAEPVAAVETARFVRDTEEETQSEGYSINNESQSDEISAPALQSSQATRAPRKGRQLMLIAAGVAILVMIGASLSYWKHARTAHASESVQIPIETAQAAAPLPAPAPQPAPAPVPEPAPASGDAPASVDNPPIQQATPPVAKPEVPKSAASATRKPAASKKVETSPSTAMVLKSAKLPEVNAQPVAVTPPVEPEPKPAPVKKVFEAGVITWNGRLNKNTVLVINDQQASIGNMSGKLPGIPVRIEVDPPSVLVRGEPSAQNGWKQLILNTGDQKLTSITIRWTALQ